MAFASDKGRQGAAGQGGAATSYDIDNSLRFNDDDSAYLSKTFGAGGSTTTWTFSCWVKFVETSGDNGIFSYGSAASNWGELKLNSSGTLAWTTTSFNSYVITDAVYRDQSAWYHIVLVGDTTQSTASDRIKIYVNGVLQSLTGTFPTINSNTLVNSATQHRLGGLYDGGNNYYFGMYLAEVNFIDGYPDGVTQSNWASTNIANGFGEFDATYGHWKPIAYAGTYGTNGFYLDFKNSGSLGTDVSGEANNWTVNNLSITDQMLDSPTNNFATLNPLAKTNSTFTLAEGNLEGTTPATGGGNIFATFAIPSTGKWYYEFVMTAGSSRIIGLSKYDPTEDYSYQGNDNVLYESGGTKAVDGSWSSYGLTWSNGDVIGMAVDTAGSITFYKNNASQGAISKSVVGLFPIITDGASATGVTGVANFGQDDTFAGASSLPTRPSGSPFNDGNYGSFFYTPPTGFLALCTKNLPDVATGLWADGNNQAFNTVTYTGNGSTQSITGVGFKPDFIWVKGRSNVYNHQLVDAVRGNTKYLYSNSTAAEVTDASARISSIDSDGFSLGTDVALNQSSNTFVAWNWKAAGYANTFNVLSGGSTTSSSSNTTAGVTAGSITTGWGVSANRDAGFSIVSYTGNGTSGATVGHGLSKAPELIMPKNRDGVGSWHGYSKTTTADYGIILNSTAAASNDSGFWNDTEPTNSLITLGTYNVFNNEKYIAYCFHSVEGYSKVGSYTGNGSSDGTFVHTGFKPAYVMIKNTTSSADWVVHDVVRNTYNTVNGTLYPSGSYAEITATARIDILSNGFKQRSTGGAWNTTNNNYIFIAFAETPTKFSTAR